MRSVLSILLGLCVFGLVISGCSDDKTTTPKTEDRQFLAGGGRLENADPFAGRDDSTGYNMPDHWPYPGQMVLFYSDINCLGQPAQRVIRDSVEWRRWWDSAWACLPICPDSNWPPRDSSGLDSIGGDSITVDTIDLDSYPPDTAFGLAPYVDFDNNVVIVIALEEETSFGRMIWIDEVTSESQVRYTVTQLGDDCISMLMRPEIVTPTSPTIAVMAPRPVDEPVTWARHDTVWSCSWEPDPNEPIAVYYTDTPCELGLDEQMIVDEDNYRQWLSTAMACDSVRWWNIMVDSGFATGYGAIGGFGFEVDFSTHAVIILRAGDQTRWGGGVWLNSLETSGDNTIIEYTVMEPADDCPIIDGLSEVNPTVAIRVPRPVGNAASWNRHTETIECSWPDSTFVGNPSDGGW